MSARHWRRRGVGPFGSWSATCCGIAIRLVGHGEHDDSHYVDPQLRESALGRDCLTVAELGFKMKAGRVHRLWKLGAGIHYIKLRKPLFSVREAAPDPAREDWCAFATREFAEG